MRNVPRETGSQKIRDHKHCLDSSVHYVLASSQTDRADLDTNTSGQKTQRPGQRRLFLEPGDSNKMSSGLGGTRLSCLCASTSMSLPMPHLCGSLHLLLGFEKHDTVIQSCAD
jgi:hypothetical protein